MAFRVDNRPTGSNSTACDSAPSVTEDLDGTSDLVRELDHRSSDRIDVWLLWREHDDLVFVEVADRKTGEHFAIEVRGRERPLEVFRHPYAHAAWRRIETRSGSGQVIASAG